MNNDLDAWIKNVEKSTSINLAKKYDVHDLLKIKSKVVTQGEDAHIVDDAIKIRTKMDNEKIKEEERFRKANRKVILGGLFSGFFGGLLGGSNLPSNKDLSPWEINEINKQNYEPMNFDEEDMDEDDFYSDDLD